MGVVDSDYSGPNDEIKIQVLNVSASVVEVRRGDRLAQGVIMPFVRAAWTEPGGPSSPNRGGFGSTGM